MIHRFVLLTALLLLMNPQSTQGHYCRTKAPSHEEAEAAQVEIKKFDRRRKAARSSSRLCTQCISIDTYFWVFQPDATLQDEDVIYRVDRQIAQDQFDVLVDRYRDSPFTFNLLGIEIITNNQYYKQFDGIEEQIGAEYRRGGWDTLNVYFGGAGEGSFAFFPTLRSVESDGVPNAIDGAWNDISTMPGVDPDLSACCRLGITCVHEVGHWLGLHHTFEQQAGFEDNGCNPGNPNDYVDDTPQQATNTPFTCPSDSTDTCPGLPGNDPIHNYMDYSSDDCYTEFTRGQMDRMFAVWSLFRKRDEVCGTGTSEFEFEIKTDENAGQTNWQIEATDGSFLVNQNDGGFEHDINEHSTSTLNHDLCLTNGKEFKFTIFDSAGNGLSGGFGYTVKLNGVMIKEGSNFGSSEVTTFTTTGDIVTASPTPPPTPPPTTPPPPPGTITVEILFDAYPEEVGVSLTDADGGQTYINRPEGSFSDATYGEQKYLETVSLVDGQSYKLTVTDSFGDGIQGDDGSPNTGYYAIYYGDTPDPANQILRENNFADANDEVTFTVTNPNPPSATPAPTSVSAPPGFCFSGVTEVNVLHKGLIQMKDLQLNDKVLAANGKYERVFSFGHRDPDHATDFLQFAPSKLELSPDHMVYMEGQSAPIPAKMVKVGDRFATGEIVEAIERIVREGIYAPFTISGTIVVNGVPASNYVSLQGSAVLLLGPSGIATPLTHQWLDHSYVAAQRIWCYWLGMDDVVSERGYSVWAEKPHAIADWFLSQNLVVMTVLTVPFVSLLALLNVVESLFVCPSIGVIVAVASVVYLRRGRKTKELSL